jgi:hypothetical protein
LLAAARLYIPVAALLLSHEALITAPHAVLGGRRHHKDQRESRDHQNSFGHSVFPHVDATDGFRLPACCCRASDRRGEFDPQPSPGQVDKTPAGTVLSGSLDDRHGAALHHLFLPQVRSASARAPVVRIL